MPRKGTVVQAPTHMKMKFARCVYHHQSCYLQVQKVTNVKPIHVRPNDAHRHIDTKVHVETESFPSSFSLHAPAFSLAIAHKYNEYMALSNGIRTCEPNAMTYGVRCPCAVYAARDDECQGMMMSSPYMLPMAVNFQVAYPRAVFGCGSSPANGSCW